MFDLLDKPLHWITVKWPALLSPENESDLSEPGEYIVELRVELLDRDESIWRFGLSKIDEAEDVARLKEKFGDKAPDTFETAKRVIKDWRKIKANGKRVPLNDENLKLLLAAPMFEQALGNAYILALGGVVEEREKNSPGSPSDGRADADTETGTKSKKTANASD